MKKPELTGVTWLEKKPNPTHLVGQCSLCLEMLSVPKNAGDAQVRAALDSAFGEHVKSKHSPEDFSQAAHRIVEQATRNK